MTLKFCTSVAKGLKLKVRNSWGLIPVCRGYRGKTGRGPWRPPLPSRIGLKGLCAYTQFFKKLRPLL